MSDALIQAEQTANRIRGELLRTLEELERRRENLSDWKGQLRQNAGVLLAAGGVMGGFVALKVGYRLHERRKWGSHLNHLRVKAAKRAWNRPQQLAAPSERSAVATFALAVAGAFASAFAATLAKRAAERVLQSGGTERVQLRGAERLRRRRVERIEIAPRPVGTVAIEASAATAGVELAPPGAEAPVSLQTGPDPKRTH